MKLIYIIIASIFLQLSDCDNNNQVVSDCDNNQVVSNILFGLDMSKPNKQLITQLKSDTRFTNYIRNTRELPGTGMTVTTADFDFSDHPIVKKKGSIKIYETSDNGMSDIGFYFICKTEDEAKKAFQILSSELNKGCFEKKKWGEESVDYKSTKVSVYLSYKNFGTYTSLSINIDK